MLLKFIKISANIVDKYLTSIINHDILRSYFSDGAKNALVRPIYKKKDRENRKITVSILNGFSKVYERFSHLLKTLMILKYYSVN